MEKTNHLGSNGVAPNGHRSSKKEQTCRDDNCKFYPGAPDWKNPPKQVVRPEVRVEDTVDRQKWDSKRQSCPNQKYCGFDPTEVGHLAEQDKETGQQQWPRPMLNRSSRQVYPGTEQCAWW